MWSAHGNRQQRWGGAGVRSGKHRRLGGTATTATGDSRRSTGNAANRSAGASRVLFFVGEAAGVCCRCCLEAAPAPVCWRNSKWWCSAAPQLKPRGSQPPDNTSNKIPQPAPKRKAPWKPRQTGCRRCPCRAGSRGWFSWRSLRVGRVCRDGPQRRPTSVACPRVRSASCKIHLPSAQPYVYRAKLNTTAFSACNPVNFPHLARVGPLYDKRVSHPLECQLLW